MALAAFCVNACGWMINMKILPHFFSFFSLENMRFQNIDVVLFGEIISGFLCLFGFIPGYPLLSIGGMVNIFSVSVLAGIILLAILQKKEGGKRDRIFLEYIICGLILNTGLFVFIKDSFAERYYLPILVFVIPFAYGCLKNLHPSGNKMKKRLYICFGCVLIFINAFRYQQMTAQNQNENLINAVEYLKTNDYEFGYASVFFADLMTELSNGKIEMYIVGDFEKILCPQWLMSKDTEKENHDGKVFVLFSETELEQSINYPWLSMGKQVYSQDGLYIYEFASTADLRMLIGNR